MVRRNFLKNASMVGVLSSNRAQGNVYNAVEPDRAYWLKTLLRIASPVLTSLANNKLKDEMPVEAVAGALTGRKEVTYLEALGRTLAGISPWLELDDPDSGENPLKEKYILLSIDSIKNAVNPSSGNYMNFTKGGQPLVDAAFLAHALLRAPKKLYGNLEKDTQSQLIAALRSTRQIKPHYSNWLLFTAMVEAALLKFTGEYDPVRIDYAIKEHQTWYKGDGVYGDGPDFHFDYYNSFVIQPMLLDITRTMVEMTGTLPDEFTAFLKRAQRYGEIQERLISPEGTFPPVGRSVAYRCGAFQLLAQLSLQKQLPKSLSSGQVRSALTAVIKKTMDAPGTFDTKGWLTIGLSGHQPSVGESYISTGSLYLCTTAFLPLGLSGKDEFWTSPGQEWTSKRAFSGQTFAIDKAL